MVPLPFEASIHCVNDGELDIQVSSPVLNGAMAIVDYADTANTSSFYEAHDVTPTAADDSGTVFGLTLAMGGDYNPGFSSLYPCGTGAFFDEANVGDVMTYVVRVYDSSSSLYDCFAAGNDPSGMLDKSYPDYGNTIDHGDVSPSNCATFRSAQ